MSTSRPHLLYCCLCQKTFLPSFLLWRKEIANSLGTISVHSFQWNGPFQPYQKTLDKNGGKTNQFSMFITTLFKFFQIKFCCQSFLKKKLTMTNDLIFKSLAALNAFVCTKFAKVKWTKEAPNNRSIFLVQNGRGCASQMWACQISASV